MQVPQSPQSTGPMAGDCTPQAGTRRRPHETRWKTLRSNEVRPLSVWLAWARRGAMCRNSATRSRCNDEFVDRGFSGTKDRRPALDRLMEAAWAGKFPVVLVWRFDRFARSVKHLLSALETFRGLRVDFISLQEQFDTSTPSPGESKNLPTTSSPSSPLGPELARLLALPLDRFAQEGSLLEVRAPWLPMTLWFVPAETLAGNYSSTITVSAVSGP